MKQLLQKIHFILLSDGGKRAKYLKKKNLLMGIGNNCIFQSRNFPMDPKLVKLHNNITIAAHVHFVTHDAIRHVLYYKYNKRFGSSMGCIEIMDNVFVGLGTIIMPNVKIGENCIIGAGSVVTKDIPPNSVVAGVPAKRICSFDEYMKKRKEITQEEEKMTYIDLVDNCWDNFYKNRGDNNENIKNN